MNLKVIIPKLHLLQEKPRIKFDISKTHDAPFKPSSPTKGAFGAYPEYKSNPVHIAVRQKDEGMAKKDAFK